MNIHLSAEPRDIAETVLLPGDPLRAKGIADKLLDKVVCYNQTRGMLGFTGSYNGKSVSVQGTGMGMPSTAIYAQELINLGAKRLIRVGTCGAYQANINLGDIVIASTASTDSSMNKHIFDQKDFAPSAHIPLLVKALEIAKTMSVKIHVGNILSSDTFYNTCSDHWQKWAEYGVLAVEMETSALYTIGAKNKIETLSILTVSDSLVTGKVATIEDRQNNYYSMAEIALRLI